MDVVADYKQRLSKAIAGLTKDSLPELDEEEEIVETETAEPAVQKRAAAAPVTINLFQHPDSHPLVLDLALLRHYGPEWLEWEPETLELRIPQDFRTTSVSDLNMEKLQAMKTLHFVDSYWQRWEVFIWCTMPLNGEYADFEYAQVPTAAQCLVSVDIANRVRDDVPWSDEVKAYVGTAFLHDGVLCPIAPCDFAEVDTTNLIISCAEIGERWPEVRDKGVAPTEETPIAEQLRRCLAAHQYLEEARERLRLQLSLIDNA